MNEKTVYGDKLTVNQVYDFLKEKNLPEQDFEIAAGLGQISEYSHNGESYVDKGELEGIYYEKIGENSLEGVLDNPQSTQKQQDRFILDSNFVRKYEKRSPPFGFNGLGEFTYMRTYSRVKEDGTNENWHETVQRIVEGTYNMQKEYVKGMRKAWDDHQGQQSAQEMYDRMWQMKFLPPGRGIWGMGTDITEEKRLYAALNNCAFVSTDNLKEDLERPFTFLMDASMLGVGVGFDTKGEGQIIIKKPDEERQAEFYDIPDTREGWVKSVGILLRSYFLGDPKVEFGYDGIRPEGAPIKTFGGKASGPEPLKALHEDLKNTLEGRIGGPITTTDIVDIQNLIGRTVVAGNVRRTAEIAFGDPESEEFLNLKNYKVNPDRQGWGWASNNSIFAELGMDYEDIATRIRDNGEPGLAWLDNMREFGRMGDPKNNKDRKVKGGNPCLEQSLESYELCCLVENFLARHESKEDFLRTLKFSYLYAKTVTLGETHWPETNEVMMRNRRIGSSVSGVTQFVNENGMGKLNEWLRNGYDEIQKWDEVYSDWLAIPRSIKTTSVKPSGTVSLLVGATPGMHFPHSEHYIRRVRLAKNSELVERMAASGYPIEQDKYDSSSLVVEFPVNEGEGIRSKSEVSMWEQLTLAAFIQEHWADNQVSATITFDPKREGKDIAPALDHFQYRLKGISFLPSEDHGYEQAPYEKITEDEYNERISKLKPLDFEKLGEESKSEKFCDGEACEIDFTQKKS
jgi:ribonucleoside-triphosphate reductase (thioredoxin)